MFFDKYYLLAFKTLHDTHFKEVCVINMEEKNGFNAFQYYFSNSLISLICTRYVKFTFLNQTGFFCSLNLALKLLSLLSTIKFKG